MPTQKKKSRSKKKTAAPKRPRSAASKKGGPQHQLKNGTMHAWYIGWVFAACNLVILCALVPLTLLYMIYTNSWEYMVMAWPLVYILFWVWGTQTIVRTDKTITIADALLIAKVSVLPFVLLFVASLVTYTVALAQAEVTEYVITLSYLGMLIGIGSMITALPIMTFFLKNRVSVTALRRG